MKLTYLFGITGLVVLICVALAAQAVFYPYGVRRAAMGVVYYALMNYAQDHDGMLPVSERGPAAALSQLYPHYSPNGAELAGLSMNVGHTMSVLRSRGTLDESSTSWVYFSGLRAKDNPLLAVLYEREPGILSSGRRCWDNGHAVLLLDGTITNVPGNAWTSFLKEQEALRKR